jgi:hypothetical protein
MVVTDLLLGIASKVFDKVFPDPVKAAEAKLELYKLQQSGELTAMLAQTDINKAEAASSSVFVAGARPFIMWVCGIGCAWNWIGLPVACFIMAIMNIPIDIRPADLSEMMPLLFGMLGLGSLRTVEKIKGVATL